MRVYEVELAPGAREVRLDGKAVRPLARYFGGFNVVVFTPEDLALPRGAPADRRRFLDRGVFNLRARLPRRRRRTTSKVLKHAQQRAAAGRRRARSAGARSRSCSPSTTSSSRGSAVAIDRARGGGSSTTLRAELAAAFAAITRTGLGRAARYVVEARRRDRPSEIVAQLRAGRARDLATQSTQLGPHRDDVVLRARRPRGRQLRVAGPAARDHARVEDRRARPCSAASTATCRSSCSTTSRASSIPRATSTCSSTSRRSAGQCFITTTHAGHVLLRRDRADYRIADRPDSRSEFRQL